MASFNGLAVDETLSPTTLTRHNALVRFSDTQPADDYSHIKLTAMLFHARSIIGGRGAPVGRLLNSHRGETGSIPGRVTPRLSQVGIAPDDAAGRWVFSRISRFPLFCIPALHHSHLISPSSVFKTSLACKPLAYKGMHASYFHTRACMQGLACQPLAYKLASHAIQVDAGVHLLVQERRPYVSGFRLRRPAPDTASDVPSHPRLLTSQPTTPENIREEEIASINSGYRQAMGQGLVWHCTGQDVLVKVTWIQYGCCVIGMKEQEKIKAVRILEADPGSLLTLDRLDTVHLRTTCYWKNCRRGTWISNSPSSDYNSATLHLSCEGRAHLTTRGIPGRPSLVALQAARPVNTLAPTAGHFPVKHECVNQAFACVRMSGMSMQHDISFMFGASTRHFFRGWVGDQLRRRSNSQRAEELTRLAKFALLFGKRLHFNVLYVQEPASFFHWLLRKCQDTPFLNEPHLVGAHHYEVFNDWRSVTQGVSHTGHVLVAADGATNKLLQDCSFADLIEAFAVLLDMLPTEAMSTLNCPAAWCQRELTRRPPDVSSVPCSLCGGNPAPHPRQFDLLNLNRRTLQYPPERERVWLIVQHALYNISTKWEKVIILVEPTLGIIEALLATGYEVLDRSDSNIGTENDIAMFSNSDDALWLFPSLAHVVSVRRLRSLSCFRKRSECHVLDLYSTVAELLASHQGDRGSIPARVTSDFCMWESCRTMPLISGFSRGSPVSTALSFRRCSIHTSVTLIGS
ncbi:hypothetical protein PR048_026903 [Dryococelus australis]|uniref:Uncharacterized protein n=1 Tax=Dryococelus australis TaxID=614101 RepID=A0ABQ9GMN0_9NEOP|nr:hypothetical protein PR048_026903 [Dryococelus australis]